ncbi:hypothetical protein [Fimbriiglobus ruber]|uniref:Uncharacterized protein n=1 Tax=Fimbriiglobus ruber TaxID=1908690 RepID=A0A225D1Y7_9BACT|nr:hypothetical protein [Fimbriiglobus ruber]OWK34943.1 hypothetical protein FRUB_09785 [Fimbriiglobus ruber]
MTEENQNRIENCDPTLASLYAEAVDLGWTFWKDAGDSCHAMGPSGFDPDSDPERTKRIARVRELIAGPRIQELVGYAELFDAVNPRVRIKRGGDALRFLHFECKAHVCRF